jgi:hypothetical protein
VARAPLGAVSVQVIENRLPGIIQAFSPAISKAVGQTCFALVKGWKQRAHVDTSAYRNSITTDYRSGALGASVYTPLDYPYWEEYGNRFRPGHPAFRPAVEVESKEHPDRIRHALAQAVR